MTMLWLVGAYAFAAGGIMTCNGTVVDENGEPIVGASIVITDGKALGTSDVNGHFTVKAPDNTKSLTFSYVGYEKRTEKAQPRMGTIRLEPSSEILNDVVVTQSLARTRQTPVAVSQSTRLKSTSSSVHRNFPKFSIQPPASGLRKTAAVSAMPKSTCAASRARMWLSS